MNEEREGKKERKGGRKEIKGMDGEWKDGRHEGRTGWDLSKMTNWSIESLFSAGSKPTEIRIDEAMTN